MLIRRLQVEDILQTARGLTAAHLQAGFEGPSAQLKAFYDRVKGRTEASKLWPLWIDRRLLDPGLLLSLLLEGSILVCLVHGGAWGVCKSVPGIYGWLQ